ncbi:hypothetical protein Pmani_003895 [Petrolisthes manimaculis]|uniref:Cytochrome P450 n=1 Tax=Petrolisthes manimaculis TaxID=1843537 RepID=A0AAE1UI07_9EUCA|nr:hypothetical protein Pmani_003895 [Petrolisthes manimaculis]
MLGGYVIPKGAILNSSNIIIHHSSRYWDEPHLFKPERWLDNNGKFNTKKEGFMPFSIAPQIHILCDVMGTFGYDVDSSHSPSSAQLRDKTKFDRFM